MGEQNANHVPEQNRLRLAMWMLVASVVTLGVVSVILLLTADSKDEAGRLVFASLLPLLGSWVGTILAFYFSRENLEAATRSAETLTRMSRDEKLRSIAVVDKMIPLNSMVVQRIAAGAEDQIVLASLANSDQTRHPILDTNNLPKYMVHRSAVDRFLAKKAVDGVAAADLAKLTMKDLLQDSEIGALVKSTFETISSKATLADAKAAMERRTACQDVFVTESGKPDSAVIGWLTNIEISKAARA